MTLDPVESHEPARWSTPGMPLIHDTRLVRSRPPLRIPRGVGTVAFLTLAVAIGFVVFAACQAAERYFLPEACLSYTMQGTTESAK